MKQNLGKKYKLRWNVFIDFLKSESSRIRNKLTKDTESNILEKVKKTKFGLEKYTEKNFKENVRMNTNKFYITNFRWLKYSHNSCRYDVFSTLYIFLLFDYINANLSIMNDKIKNIHVFFEDIKKEKSENALNKLWEYCIRNKIDIEKTEINNIDLTVESGFGLNGAIVQLFSIFKNDYNFCIQEKRQETCQICNNILDFAPSFHSHLIIIDEPSLKMNNIEMIINYSLVYDGLMTCNKYNLGKNFPTSRITYQIITYPKFLFILFDLRSYEQLKKNKNLLQKFFLEKLNLTEKDFYNLKGCVTCPSYNHFTLFINNLDISFDFEELENKKNYYYYDTEFNGNFQLCHTSDLYEIFTYDILPYLLVYEKI